MEMHLPSGQFEHHLHVCNENRFQREYLIVCVGGCSVKLLFKGLEVLCPPLTDRIHLGLIYEILISRVEMSHTLITIKLYLNYNISPFTPNICNPG